MIMEIDPQTLESLRNLDVILDANLFAVLAGLSITVAAFLSILTQDKDKFLRELLNTVSRLPEETDAEKDLKVAAEKVNGERVADSGSLKNARDNAVAAFFLFVFGLAATFGFDSVTKDMSATFEITDVATTGVALSAGIYLLSVAASALVSSNTAVLLAVFNAVTVAPRFVWRNTKKHTSK